MRLPTTSASSIARSRGTMPPGGESLRAGEAAAVGRRVGFAQRGIDCVGVGARALRLQLGEALGRQLTGVLLLDPLQPLGAGGLLGAVDVDPLRRRVLVDL